MASKRASQPAHQQRILLTQAEAGMILAQPVASLKQAVLCSEGTTLSDELIHRLMLLGIKRVVVTGAPATYQRPPELHEQEAMLEQRFSRCITVPLMKQISDAVRRNLREAQR